MENNNISFWQEDNFIPLAKIDQKIKNIIQNDLITKEGNIVEFKKFHEEIMPLVFLAHQLNVVSIQFTDDTKICKSHDAIFKLISGEDKKIEVTCAIDEKQIPLKKYHLEKYGYVSANIDTQFEKVKNKKIVKQSPKFFFGRGEKKRANILSLIKKAFDHKNSLNREDYKNEILLIVVDTDGTNIKKLNSHVNETMYDIFTDKGIFDRVFLISKNSLKYDEFFIEI